SMTVKVMRSIEDSERNSKMLRQPSAAGTQQRTTRLSVSDALQSRISVRAFCDKPVPQEVLEEIFSLARFAPSNCNVQPWQGYVVSGAKKDQLRDELVEAVLRGHPANPDFDWEVKYQGVHRERQFASADALYSAMSMERTDKARRHVAMLRNWHFFDAPHAVFFAMKKYLMLPGAADIGIYAQTLSLLMTERGIASCMQGALGLFPEPARKMFSLPDDIGILFGMSFGYADYDAPANKAITDRADLGTTVRFF
ncbi:MAG: nitroreductase, partial [Pseudorhodoplanes sp.]|nr:nitroreductase [Pseudorhodoplanes sp.]